MKQLNRFQKRWLMSAAVFLGCTVLAIFIGISVNHMTIPRTEVSSTKENDADKTSSAAGTKATESTTAAPAATKPSTTAAPRLNSLIKELTPVKIGLLSESYSMTVEPYSIAGDKDDVNRPVNCLNYQSRFSGISDNITVFSGPDLNTRQVSLSFVCIGDINGNTEYILNKLAERHVQASFFITLAFAEENPGLVERIIREGHVLGTVGSVVPPSGLSELSLEEIQQNLLDFQRYIEDTFEYSPNAFYYCCDRFSEASLKLISEMGYRVCYYSIDFDDTNAAAAIDSSLMLETIKQNLHPSASIVLHNVNTATLIVLPNLISYLEETGYEIVLQHNKVNE